MYKNKILYPNIAYFKYSESSGQHSFQEGYEKHLETIKKPEVDAMLVIVLDPKKNWGAKGQAAWLETGRLAEKAGLKKWGAVCCDTRKNLILKYLMRGGDKAKRSYDSFVTTDETECLKWLRGK